MVFFRPGQRCRWEITKKPHVGELNGATQHPASGLPRPQPDGELQRPDEAEHAVAARLHQPGVAAARRPLERGHRPVLDVEREDEVAVRREVRRAPHHGGRLAAEVDARGRSTNTCGAVVHLPVRDKNAAPNRRPPSVTVVYTAATRNGPSASASSSSQISVALHRME